MSENQSLESLKAGTGFMNSLSEALRALQAKGYVANLVPRYDRLECNSGEVVLHPHEFKIDEMVRFENTSDPDDQAILYAISSESKRVKGVYVESYGLYHDDLSRSMIERLKRHQPKPDLPH